VKWSLSKHARPPNPTNLDVHYQLPEEGLWNTYLRSEDTMIMPLVDTTSITAPDEPIGPRKLINNEAADEENFRSLLDMPKLDAAPSPNTKPVRSSNLIRKLRWANIGWFYHWGTKQYDFTRGKAEIDDRLRAICRKAVASVNWASVFTSPLRWGEKGEEWQTWDESYGTYLSSSQILC
jgi:alkylated DNA repair protein alkB homolog 1